MLLPFLKRSGAVFLFTGLLLFVNPFYDGRHILISVH